MFNICSIRTFKLELLHSVFELRNRSMCFI